MIKTFSVINKFHLGIYAIILKNRSIVLIKKSRGPYSGKLDLPGGKPEHGETLVRKVQEETGVKILTATLFNNYSTVVQQTINESVQESIHHLGMIYVISAYDDSALIKEMVAEDSLGAHWYPLDELTKDMLSPFAFKAIADSKKFSITA